jgi:PKD repeat protein
MKGGWLRRKPTLPLVAVTVVLATLTVGFATPADSPQALPSSGYSSGPTHDRLSDPAKNGPAGPGTEVPDTPIGSVVPLVSGGPFWSNLSSPTGPSFRAIGSMAYDPADGYDVLFGGLGPGGPLNDTWTYANGVWTNITATSGPAPPAQDGMAMTYDYGDGYLLAWGCLIPNGTTFCNDTWSFLHGKWSKIDATVLTPTGQPFTSLIPDEVPYDSMVYDAADGYVVLTDGSVTVHYSDGLWTPFCAGGSNCTRSIPGPPEADIAYDASDGYVLSFGGLSYEGSGYVGGSYTWKFAGGTWTNITSTAGVPPSPRVTTSMVYDNASGGVLLFGGDNSHGRPLNDTWLFKGGSWQNLSSAPSPQPRYEASLAYDGADLGAVLFGGIGSVGTNTTWFWGVSPPIAALTITANDTSPLPGEPVTFGEEFRGGSGAPSYAWRFGDGGTSSAAEPVHDFVDDGYYAVHLWVNDSAGNSALAVETVDVSTPLSVASLTADPNPATLGQAVNFSVVATGGTPPYAYSWMFGDGGMGGDLASITHVFTTDGPFNVVVNVTDFDGSVVRSSINVSIGLQAVATSSSTTGTFPLTVSFTGQAQGGYPPYRYSWLFGDGVTSVQQDPTHTYNLSGHYEAVLLVTDARGSESSSTLSVDVSAQTRGAPSSPAGLSSSQWYDAFVAAVVVAIAIAAVWTTSALRERSRRREGERWIEELTSARSSEVGPDRGPK